MQEIDGLLLEEKDHALSSSFHPVISASLTFSQKFSVGCKGNLRSIAKSLQTENHGLYLKSFK